MKQQLGFTLVELAVVVFLIGLLATMGISALKAQLASAAISNTKKKQDTIKDALVAYLGRNKRLPCPATDNSGKEGTAGARLPQVPSNCPTYFGVVPYAELGLPKSAAVDGWDNFFAYAVSRQWTATLNTAPPTNGGSITNDPAFAFNIGNLGTITVNDRIPASNSTLTVIANPTATPPTGAVVVLVSHGPNGSGAYTIKWTQNAAPSGVDEIANALLPPNTLPANIPVPPVGFFQREYTDKDAGFGIFDDIVMWFSANDLLNPLIKDGALQSAQGQYATLVANIQDYVAGQIASHPCNVPTSIPPPLDVDPWGNRLNASGSPFTYCTGTNSGAACPSPFSFSSSVSATYTLANATPSAIPTPSTSGATMIRIYPFLTNCQ